MSGNKGHGVLDGHGVWVTNPHNSLNMTSSSSTQALPFRCKLQGAAGQILKMM